MAKNRMLARLVLRVLVLSSSLVASQPPQDELPKSEALYDSQFVVGPSAIRLPRGVFLLIRKGKEYGAIRLLTVKPGKDPQHGTATYESYFQGDTTGSFLAVNTAKRSGELSTKPLTGIGRLSFGGGKHKLRVGKWQFDCYFLQLMDMYPSSEEEGDHGFEFAPTSARDLSQIDVFDKQLQWFRFDANTSITLPVSGLAK